MTKFKKAFTLLEMTIVLFIIGLLILIIAPNISSQKKARKWRPYRRHDDRNSNTIRYLFRNDAS